MEMRCYRKILRISYKDHVTNEEVRAKIQKAIGPHEELLTIHFDLCVDATGVVISLVFSALISTPQAVEALSKCLTNLPVLLPLLLSHQCHQQSGGW